MIEPRGMPVKAWRQAMSMRMVGSRAGHRYAPREGSVPARQGATPDRDSTRRQELPGCPRAHSWRGARSLRTMLLMLIILTFVVSLTSAQQSAQPPEQPSGVTQPLTPSPSAQERLLAPIPPQFNWLNREAPSNSLLESLLGNAQGPSHLTLITSLSEDVGDNFTGTGGQGTWDFRTGATLGAIYRIDDGPNFVSLANTTHAFYQARSGQHQFGFANLSLNAGYQYQQLSLGFSDHFVRDDGSTLQENSSQLQALRTTRSSFLRNSASPQLRYDFTSRLTGLLGYTTTLVIDEEGNQPNTTTHTVTPGLQYQVSTNLKLGTNYTYAANQGNLRSTSQHATLDADYALNTETGVTASAFGSLVERRGTGSNNTQTYGFRVGFRRTIVTPLTLVASVGPTVVKREGEPQRLRANWQVALDGPIPIFSTPSLMLTLTTQQSVQDTVGEVTNVGLVLRLLARAQLTYTPTARLNGILFVDYSRNEFLEDTAATTTGDTRGSTTNFSSAGLSGSYALTNVLTLTTSYRYQRRDSAQARNNFDSSIFTLALSGTFVVF